MLDLWRYYLLCYINLAFSSNVITQTTMSSPNFILSLFLFFHLISSSYSASTPSQPDTVCNNTPFPKFCKSILPHNSPRSVYEFGRITIQHSLTTTKDFLSSVNDYLRSPGSLSEATISALEDCQLLATLNLDYLSTTFQNIASKNNTLQSSQADDMRTLLSASLTDLETCLDGLQETGSPDSIQKNLSSQLSNGTMSDSVSLAIFMQGWNPSSKKGRSLGERKYRFASMKPLMRRGSASLGRKLLDFPTPENVNVTTTVVVNPDGSGNFTTISDAVAAAPNNTAAGKGYFLIYVVAGVYAEYVNIATNKKYLMMIGDGINQTIITGNHSVDDGWTTFNSATFAVTGTGFVAVNMTIRNTAGAAKHQAVALRSGADLSAFYRCSFEGYQDTLYTHSLRQFYRECDVYGTVDFIFGNAAVVLQNCNLYPRLPIQGQFNAITAQGRTDINQNTGTSVENCNIQAAQDLASSNNTTQTYLGRPWKEYSRVVYMQSFMDSLINSAGWHIWSGDFALNTSYYAEFNNTGPGSNTSDRVTWLGYHVINDTDAAAFTVSNFIAGDFWLPRTGIPYFGGLL